MQIIMITCTKIDSTATDRDSSLMLVCYVDELLGNRLDIVASLAKKKVGLKSQG